MIVGSGMLAQAFSAEYKCRDDVWIYASGVSNSSCTDSREFERERQLLEQTLALAGKPNVFVYFGTCSIADPCAINTPYVQHKLEMERLVSCCANSIILRLPQVAGQSTNPHTLLNFLFLRISRGERFKLWSNARRNIIDVADVLSVARVLIADDSRRGFAINVANPVNYAMLEIVRSMEKAVGKVALCDMVEQGSTYSIDVHGLVQIFQIADIKFDDDYLDRTLIKYYQVQ